MFRFSEGRPRIWNIPGRALRAARESVLADRRLPRRESDRRSWQSAPFRRGGSGYRETTVCRIGELGGIRSPMSIASALRVVCDLDLCKACYRALAGRDSVCRNGPRDCARSVIPTAEIVRWKVGEIDPAGRYRVSRAGPMAAPRNNRREQASRSARVMIGSVVRSTDDWTPGQRVVKGV